VKVCRKRRNTHEKAGIDHNGAYLFYAKNLCLCRKDTYDWRYEYIRGQVLAEMISTLITERTGTAVNVTLYKNAQELLGRESDTG